MKIIIELKELRDFGERAAKVEAAIGLRMIEQALHEYGVYSEQLWRALRKIYLDRINQLPKRQLLMIFGGELDERTRH